jgi:hypothetical protein
MTATAFPNPAPLSLWAVTAPVAPPSGAVIAAVLAFGDINEPQADGLTLVSISPERLNQEDMRLLLDSGDHDRAGEVAVLWDPRRYEMVRIIDTAQAAPQDRRLHGFPRLTLAA